MLGWISRSIHIIKLTVKIVKNKKCTIMVCLAAESMNVGKSSR